MVRVIQCTVIRENHAAFVNKPVWCKYTNDPLLYCYRAILRKIRSCNDRRDTALLSAAYHPTLAGWINRFAHHLTTFNLGTTGLSNKSIVCLNRSFLSKAAYAFSVVLTEAWPSRC